MKTPTAASTPSDSMKTPGRSTTRDSMKMPKKKK
jgi:hypothetical protein